MATVGALLKALDASFPFARAESWDKVGLQAGSRGAEVKSVHVAYEITDAVLDEAAGSQAIVCYHPAIFRPLESLDFANPIAGFLGRILSARQNLICVHTALDGANPPRALGDVLARSLGLSNARVIAPSGKQKLVKIAVFVPPANLEAVSAAAWAAGAGKIGLYEEASFSTRGHGTFRPTEGAQPFTGQVGQRETVDEWRLEVLAPADGWRGVLAAIKKAHPYEEVAYDVYALLNEDGNQEYGPARIGDVTEQSLTDFATLVQNLLEPPSIRLVEAGPLVSQIACSPGSGASFIDAAARAGADCLVTGDIKHHDALKARALGLSIIDVTHAATERAAVPLMADALEAVEGLRVVRSGVDSNPFS